MDAVLNPVSGAAAQAYTQLTKATVAGSVPVSLQAQSTTSVLNASVNNASQNVAIVQQAAAASTFNYPLGDKEFTIFKDATGQLITRYVSLRDGSVTYAPAPILVKELQLTSGSLNSPALVALNA